MIKNYRQFINEKLDFDVKISVKDLVELIDKIFSTDKVHSVDTVYEYDKSNDYYRLIIVLDNLFYSKTNIFYSKFIFYVNKEKTHLSEKYFSYLYDINCEFKKVEFDDLENLEYSISNTISNRIFGDDIKYLSDFLVSPASFINEWLKQNNVQDFSIYNLEYTPDIKIIPCRNLYFKFSINIDDVKSVNLTFKKEDSVEDDVKYKLIFEIDNNEIEEEISDIKQLIEVIGLTLKNNYNKK